MNINADAKGKTINVEIDSSSEKKQIKHFIQSISNFLECNLSTPFLPVSFFSREIEKKRPVNPEFKTIYDFFENEDFKFAFKEAMKPIIRIIYNEMYIYIWLICIFNVFLILIILANLILLLRLKEPLR